MPNIQLTLIVAVILASGNPWLQKVTQVRRGMSRSQVEKILPPHPKYSLQSKSMMGSGQNITYQLDMHWRVSIWYDYTGAAEDENGTLSGGDSPQNKVMRLPVLEYSDLTVYTPVTVEVIKRP